MERPIAWMGVGLSPGNDLPWGKCLLNCAPGMVWCWPAAAW